MIDSNRYLSPRQLNRAVVPFTNREVLLKNMCAGSDPYQPLTSRKDVNCKNKADCTILRYPATTEVSHIMACHNPGCLGNYDFEHISFFARKRFLEGFNTVELLEQARSEREKEEIALVSLLDVEDDVIRDLHLSCKYSGQCKVTNCRDKLKTMIEAELEKQ